MRAAARTARIYGEARDWCRQRWGLTDTRETVAARKPPTGATSPAMAGEIRTTEKSFPVKTTTGGAKNLAADRILRREFPCPPAIHVCTGTSSTLVALTNRDGLSPSANRVKSA